MKPFTVHKVTHKFFGPDGTPAIAIAQRRGNRVMINRLDNGRVVEKAIAVGICANHLTGYGAGVARDRALAQDSMQNAWRFTFGTDVPVPECCEVHSDT